MRWFTMISLTTTSQPSKRCSSTGSPRRIDTLVPRPREQMTSSVERLLGIDDGGQRVVVDDDELGGVLALVALLGDDGDDGLADEAHRVGGEERRLISWLRSTIPGTAGRPTSSAVNTPTTPGACARRCRST